MRARRSTTSLAVAALCALAVAFFAPSARGFCREVNVAAPAGYDPAVMGCFYPTTNPQTGGHVMELYWKNLCVGYSLQQDASKQVTLDQAARLAGQAFAAWSGAACSAGGSPSITAKDNGPVACGMVQYNDAGPNQHVIAFRDDGWPYQDSSNVLGLTTLTVSNATGEIFDADMEINSHDFTFRVDGQPDAGGVDAGSETFDLLGIMTHEAGHFLGLAHSTDTTAVMYARYTPGPGPLADDDVAGICSIDIPDGTRSTSHGVVTATACDPTPMNGFSTQCAALITDAGPGTHSAMACPPSRGACSMARSPQHGNLTAALFGIAGLGALGIRRLRRARAMASAVAISLAALGATAMGMRNAQASVSIAVLLDELVTGASAAAVVVPIEQHATWENGRIFTYTRVQVDTVVAGRLPTELSVRTMGGSVGDIAQIVEGEAVLALGQRSLVFLRPRVDPVTSVPSDDFVVAARAQGQFSLVVGEDKKTRLLAAGAGALMAPSSARIARVAQLHPSGEAPRLARDVLQERLFDDAARDIAAAWARCHGK
jgi:hypothetical protein